MATPTIRTDFRDGGLRFMGGTVVLDGSNPTDIDLSTYCSSLLVGIANMNGSSAPGDDPSLITQDCASGAILNIYAWKNTGGTDPTLVASTDSSRVVDWFVIGVSLPRKGS